MVPEAVMSVRLLKRAKEISTPGVEENPGFTA